MGSLVAVNLGSIDVRAAASASAYGLVPAAPSFEGSSWPVVVTLPVDSGSLLNVSIGVVNLM